VNCLSSPPGPVRDRRCSIANQSSSRARDPRPRAPASRWPRAAQCRRYHGSFPADTRRRVGPETPLDPRSWVVSTGHISRVLSPLARGRPSLCRAGGPDQASGPGTQGAGPWRSAVGGAAKWCRQERKVARRPRLTDGSSGP